VSGALPGAAADDPGAVVTLLFCDEGESLMRLVGFAVPDSDEARVIGRALATADRLH